MMQADKDSAKQNSLRQEALKIKAEIEDLARQARAMDADKQLEDAFNPGQDDKKRLKDEQLAILENVNKDKLTTAAIQALAGLKDQASRGEAITMETIAGLKIGEADKDGLHFALTSSEPEWVRFLDNKIKEIFGEPVPLYLFIQEP